MKKRHVICLLSFFLLAVAAATTLWFLFPHEPRFTEEQCDLLSSGMTKEEVIALLGCPPGDYTTRKQRFVHCTGSRCSADDIKINHAGKCWCGDDGAIGLVLESDGTLRRAEYYSTLTPEPTTVMERIKGWLGIGK